MERKTRRLLPIYKTIHPETNVDRHYFSWLGGRMSIINIEDSDVIEMEKLRRYTIGRD